ncbi:hypothetical protein BSG8_17770 [Bacillus subtilis subsp. natto]|uniref:tyrosine-type recombinase/integrase n=1 Tax=Bacillus subtilis TaxID=1423 RepID=UPI0024923038|nr:tyrosine-type recombinase/integrase [Bacillus subtilis]BDB93025.1 hypothetical protein BSG8_17770 [Bacillus subtilis subsp. natto]
MNFVQPIRDPECIFYIKRFLKEQNMRNYMLFVTGINSGLRISDILQLRVRDAKRPYFNLIEKKKRIDMTPALQREFKAYVEGKEDHEFLFKSREGINKPISRSMAYKILRAAAEYVGLNNRCVIHFRDIGSKQRGQGVGSVRRVAQYKTYG